MKTVLLSLTVLLSGFKGLATATVIYPITDTGQVNCYGAFDNAPKDCTTPLPGTDGSYTGLEQEFCDYGNGTIMDMNTGLMWTQAAFGPINYANALATVPFSFAGYDDWRLPTIKELFTIMDFSGRTGRSESENIPYQNPVFEARYGTEITGRYVDGQIWSANQYVGTTFGIGENCIFGTNPIDGRIKCYPLREEKYIRYVRGTENEIGENSFTTDGTIVTDANTDLQWMQKDSGSYPDAGNKGDGTLNWVEALGFCESLSLGDFDDWRLPDAHELHSLVDYSRSPSTTSSPAIDDIFDSTSFQNEGNELDWGYYWSSTTHDDAIGMAVYISFGRALGNFSNPITGEYNVVDVHGAGAQRSDPKTDTTNIGLQAPQGDIFRGYNYARCVRGSSSKSANAPETCEATSNSTPATTSSPTTSPTTVPTGQPTKVSATLQTEVPTALPTKVPINSLTELPTTSPTRTPSTSSINVLTTSPTNSSTNVSTFLPTEVPTGSRTRVPSNLLTALPTSSPTRTLITSSTSVQTTSQTNEPTFSPTKVPTASPTLLRTTSPTETSNEGECTEDNKCTEGFLGLFARLGLLTKYQMINEFAGGCSSRCVLSFSVDRRKEDGWQCGACL